MEKRNIITPEEFQKYKDQIELMRFEWTDILVYYAILLGRDHGTKLEEIAKTYQLSENELINECNDMIKGSDIRTVTENEFLEHIPNEYIDIMKEYKEIYDKSKSNNMNIEVFLESEQVGKVITKLDEIYEETTQKIAKIISSSDLSKIPSEMYNDIKWLNKIDFQNTNANIDMKHWKSNYGGSLKGCNLISFDPYKYGYTSLLTQNDFDIQQYSVVMNSYKELNDKNLLEDFYQQNLYRVNSKSEFISNLYFLLENENAKENSDWIFEIVSKDEKASATELVKTWRIMDAEQQEKYKEIFDKIIEKAQKKEEIEETIKNTNIETLESYHDKLIELFTVNNKSFNIMSYMKTVWDVAPKEYKLTHMEEILNKRNMEFKNINELDLPTDSSKPKYVQYDTAYVQYDRNQKLIGTEHYKEILYTYFFKQFTSDLEVPENIFEDILQIYKNIRLEEISCKPEKIWENIGSINQNKYFEKFIKLQDLQNNEEKLRQIWKDTDAKVQMEKFDNFIEFISSEEVNEEKLRQIWINTDAKVQMEKF